MKRALLLLLAAFLAVPAAAQSTETFEVTATDTSRELPVGQATTIPVNVTVACAIILQQGSSVTVALATDLPATWGVSANDIAFSASADCLTGGTAGEVTKPGSILVTPTAEAVGLEKRGFTIYANATGSASETDTFAHDSEVWVAYVPGHTISTDTTFPYTFTNEDDGALEFNVTVSVQANADTMVMFENLQTSGTISGLTHQSFFFSQGDTNRTRTLAVTWTPPASWDNATITFYNFSHCLAEGVVCDPQQGQNVTWQIQNTVSGGGGGDGKESPGPGFVLVAGLAAAAFLARRRG